MNSITLLVILVTLWAAVAANSKCCPQPESEGRCGCCPDACCCMCDNVTVTMPPPTTQPPTTPLPQTTSQICVLNFLDVVFIADSSLSITPAGWVQAMQFLADFVADPFWQPVGDGGSRFGFVKFETVATTLWNITSDESDNLPDLQFAFTSQPYLAGFTNTIDGMNHGIAMLENADRDDAMYKDVAILLIDGLTNEPENFPSMIVPTANRLKDASDLVLAITIGPLLGAVGMQETEDIVMDPNNIFSVNSFAELAAALPTLLESIRVRICETILPPTPQPRTPPPPATALPTVVEMCECCCPPLPDPCEGGKIMGGAFCPTGGCGCCRFDTGGDGGRRRRR